MRQDISCIALVVADYDEALTYFIGKLNFDLIEDTPQGDKRWVLISPAGSDGCQILLAQAKNPRQARRIGDQTGGRVFLILQTDDFWRDYNAMKSQDVNFVEQPREETYGTVVVFEDLYGNRWDLLQRKAAVETASI